LPIIIDDPLSLVGQNRGQRLAEQLVEFAAGGHQILVVTSNPAHAQVFADLDVPIADFAHRQRGVTPVPDDDRWRTDHLPNAETLLPPPPMQPAQPHPSDYERRPEFRYA